MVLKLTLKPGERAAVNGAVIVNGDRRASLVIENRARVLREIDIMQPEEATTPARRIYFPVMMMYLDASTRKTMSAEFEARLTEFISAVTDSEALGTCAGVAADVANEDYYKALRKCRSLMEFEESRLAHVL